MGDVVGFVPKPRTREIVCEWLEPEEGAEPLAATIVVNLSFWEVDYINELLSNPKVTYQELFDVVAPKVVGWNAMAVDRATGELAPVEPPAEVGTDALRVVDPMITIWLARALSRVHYGGEERSGKSKPSAGSPAPADGENTTSPPPTGKRSRKPHLNSGES